MKRAQHDKMVSSFNLDNLMVTLRGPSAKHFWESLERMSEQLEELGIQE